MGEIGGQMEGAPHQLALSQGENYSAQSRLARQKQQKRDMRNRVLGFLGRILIMIALMFILAT